MLTCCKSPLQYKNKQVMFLILPKSKRVYSLSMISKTGTKLHPLNNTANENVWILKIDFNLLHFCKRFEKWKYINLYVVLIKTS